jgi:predicted DNA-binding protein with PD1-like motif
VIFGASVFRIEEEVIQMEAKQIHEENGQKTFALVFDTGNEVMAGLSGFAAENDLNAASITAIGAFSDATLGYFDMERKEYKQIPVDEQVEVLSLIGDIAPKEDGEPQVHAHVVLGRSDGTTKGGHLLEARVRPTLEVILTESPEHLRRRTDEETGLPLIDL